MSTIFSRIASGEIPSYRIAEDENHYAFLDINPVAAGHTLVIPKREVDYIFDLSDKELADLHVFAKKVAIALKEAVPCVRIATATIGLEVPHVHIHLIPISKESDMDFRAPKKEFSADEMKEMARKISEKFHQGK